MHNLLLPGPRLTDASTTYLDRRIATRDLLDLMEHNLFSLDLRRRSARSVEIKNLQHRVKYHVIAPENVGIAPLPAKDILLFCASHIREAADRNLPISPYFSKIPLSVILSFIHRSDGGKSRTLLIRQLYQLQATTVVLSTFDTAFTWIAELQFHRSNTGSVSAVSFLLNNYCYQEALNPKRILTISEEYFSIERPLARWLYEFLRKRRGGMFRFEYLYARANCASSKPEFKRILKKIVEEGEIPSFEMRLYSSAHGEEGIVAELVGKPASSITAEI